MKSAYFPKQNETEESNSPPRETRNRYKTLDSGEQNSPKINSKRNYFKKGQDSKANLLNSLQKTGQSLRDSNASSVAMNDKKTYS